MNRSILKGALAALAILACTGLAAQDEELAKPKPKATKQHKAKKPRIPDSQRVDINSATKEQLMKLKGVSAKDADAIISGRPYLTKAKLITSNLIQMTTYTAIKDRIVAKQDLKNPPKPAPKLAPAPKK